MDLNQRKLTKEEWNGIEIPVNDREKNILNLITNGFQNVQIKNNHNVSLIDFLKIPPTPVSIDYTFENYLVPKLKSLRKKYSIMEYPQLNSSSKMKKADMIRISNNDKDMGDNLEKIFEFKLIEHFTSMLSKLKKNSKKWILHFYTLKILITYNIRNVNSHLKQYILDVINPYESRLTKLELIKHAYELIEKNNDLLKYADEELYDHQKQLFTVSKSPNPKLILYIAPTGTGKTMSPIGLSERYKVIFVCAARHVGLALARSAISIGKKVAFAFGCNDAEDIRLHYFAAKDYTVNRRTGSIWKVDNTVGDKVEIMISDIKSYLPAMYYMQAFNPVENIVLYWDEPTITMDYEEHEFHQIIKKNWTNNIIPNIVLSSATLPFEDEMMETIMDFKNKFVDRSPEVHSIVSYDCKKTIPLINKDGYVVMPHYLHSDYDKLKETVKHCEKFKTLMRYLDLTEATKFINYINENKLYQSEQDNLENQRYFPTLESVNMQNIKLYYLRLLKRIKKDKWDMVYKYMIDTREKKYNSTIMVTTQDAFTLTDGPTIFLADDVKKIANFCIQTAKIPEDVIKGLTEVISHNNIINSRMSELEKDIEDVLAEENEKKINEGKTNPEVKRMNKKLEEMRQCIKRVALNEMFVPNTKLHLSRFTSENNKSNAFTSDISEQIVESIMQIHGIEDSWKLLLMMGIGVFASDMNTTYLEIMKKLAVSQKLYMIIASTDYIYGTNYQFCHGYISKDLGGMSQEKCIQAMGRVGRTNLQYSYSIRFRDDELIYKLFETEDNKPEVLNMSRLFVSE